MRITAAAKAAWSSRPSRAALILLLMLVPAAVAGSSSAVAAFSDGRDQKITSARIEHPTRPRLTDETERRAAPLKVAQSSGGLLDGLFSVFKPKPKRPPMQNVESPAIKVRRSIPLSPKPLAIGVGSDMPDGLDRPLAPRPRFYASYRTMCVRLCDGYYWPVNSGTQSSNVTRDRKVCEQSCRSETKLYIQYSLGADAGDMRDLSGIPYRKLKTAFRYRKSYDPTCYCKPDPWSGSELLRHEEYRAAESGGAIGEPAPADGGADAAMTDQVVIRDTLARETDAPTELDLATGDGSSLASEPVPEAAAIAAETVAVLRKASLSKSRRSAEPAEAPRKASVPKSIAPVLAPADSVDQAKAKPVKKQRDINARASR